jgi:hypothetical protein
MMRAARSMVRPVAPWETAHGRSADSNKDRVMRIYIFKSEARKGLQAFAGDLAGSKLPPQHGPWTATGAIGPEKAPPYKFSRAAIEEAIDAQGFQLWRLAK